MEDARRTASAALEAAGAAVRRAEDGGDNLGVMAELSRVRSEDLFQASQCRQLLFEKSYRYSGDKGTRKFNPTMYYQHLIEGGRWPGPELG